MIDTAQKYAESLCKLRTKKEKLELICWAESEIKEWKLFIKEVKKRIKSNK